ncbi:ATP-binding protein [Mesobacillus zeae]|uniref:ATP-binding protein n=1 Tax=Mesobacillus zeae TaxID=1917180 RepID=UPI0015E694D8|nr:ATP-binding protein [Mesobacillus zeae]
MKEIRLLNLSLRNFKGVKNIIIDASGESMKVYGDNATGKTTLFDGFLWLLFDKDSQNKKDFAIKTLSGGQVIHNLEHSVEATFQVDGHKLTLKKVFSEKWTKKRGAVQAEFTGHTTDYYIDGVPSKKKEYDGLISELVDEDVFKLITSPSYFNEQVKWQDRRKVLLEICGDISDDEVITGNQSLVKLPDILAGRSIENHRKVIAARRSEINKEIDKIPVRISEINHNMPSLDRVDKESLVSEISCINAEIDDKMTQISSIRNGKAIADKQTRIQQIEMDLLQIKRTHESGSKEHVYQLRARLQEEESNLKIIQRDIENLKQQKRYNDDNIKRIEAQLEQLRQDWHTVNDQEFTHTEACECPACGQGLPEEQVTDAKEKALSQFNLKKAKQLEEVKAKGKRGKEQKEHFLSENEKLAKEYEKLNGQVAAKQELAVKLETQLHQAESLVVDVTENSDYVSKLQEKQAIQTEISSLQQMAEQSIMDIQTEIISLKSKRDQLQSEVGKFAYAQQSEKRIEELETEQKYLAAEFEKLEEELYLTEEFIRSKVNMLEEKINSRFKYARFKLFEQQINGGLQEVCETLYQGVPYSSGLNNAAKINVGLDIINTLSEHFQFRAPIFVDNAEAVTQLIDTNSQVISLVVSEKDKVLRIEKQHGEMKEAI